MTPLPKPPRPAGAAWGRRERIADPGGGQLYILAYELGALCLPSLEAAYRAHRHRGFRAWRRGGAPEADAGPSAGRGGGAAEAAGEAAAVEASAAGEAPPGSSGGEPAAPPRTPTRKGEARKGAPTVEFYAARQAAPPAGLGRSGGGGAAAPAPARVMLPVPYPLPPEPYAPDDKPWAWDAGHEYYGQRRDVLGRLRWEGWRAGKAG
jgi:hypothetical protein